MSRCHKVYGSTGRKFRAKRPNDREYTYFGVDYVAAVTAYAAWCNASRRNTRSVAWLLDLCTGQVWPARVEAGKMAERTLRDYRRDKTILITGLGQCPLDTLKPSHIAKFRDARQVDAPSHVRNEMACLSSALAYAVEQDFIRTNPALQVRRPSKQVRDRLIDDWEYLKVYQRCLPSLQLAMTLAIRTLALPADVLKLGPRNVKRYDDGTRTLRWSRGKTNVKVEVAIVGELAVASSHSSQIKLSIQRLCDAKTDYRTPLMESVRCSGERALAIPVAASATRRTGMLYRISVCATCAPKAPLRCTVPASTSDISRSCLAIRA